MNVKRKMTVEDWRDKVENQTEGSFIIRQLSNTVVYQVGQWLTTQDVQEAISNGIEVTIKPRSW